MEYSLQTQTLQFLLSGAFGVLLGVHYDFLRALRRVCRALTVILDLWFCLTMLVGMVGLTLYGGHGRCHLFMFFGMLLGAFGYFIGPGVFLLRLFDCVFAWLRAFKNKSMKILKTLFSNGKKSGKIVFGKVGKILHMRKRGECADANQT